MESISWLRRACRVAIAKPLAAIGVKREQIIVLRLILGVLAALALAVGPEWFAAGAGLFLASLLLERSDGGFKNAPDQLSPACNHFALITYGLTNALVFIGLGIGLRDGIHGRWEILMGACAAVALAILPWLVKKLESIDGKRSAEFEGIAGIDADDALVFVPVALWAGWAEGLLMVAAFGGAAFVGALYMTHFRKFHAK